MSGAAPSLIALLLLTALSLLALMAILMLALHRSLTAIPEPKDDIALTKASVSQTTRVP
jgi:hypothetical protein